MVCIFICPSVPPKLGVEQAGSLQPYMDGERGSNITALSPDKFQKTQELDLQDMPKSHRGEADRVCPSPHAAGEQCASHTSSGLTVGTSIALCHP